MSLLQRFATVGKGQLRSLSALQPKHQVVVSSIRGFSSAREKLQSVFENYRKKNYRQELPSRFAKEMAKAADANGDGHISVPELEKLLENIGAKDSLTEDEITEVIQELVSNEGDKEAPVQSVVDYLKTGAKPGMT